jgi:putative Holliday junction resolvase
MKKGSVVGIDFGEKRIGVAVSDSEKKIAFSLDVVQRSESSFGIKKLMRILKGRDVDSFVVGVPYREDGASVRETHEVFSYIESLREHFNVPVYTWDERYSTMIAEHTMISAHVSREGRKAVIDKVAAQVILQSWLDAHEKYTE